MLNNNLVGYRHPRGCYIKYPHPQMLKSNIRIHSRIRGCQKIDIWYIVNQEVYHIVTNSCSFGPRPWQRLSLIIKNCSRNSSSLASQNKTHTHGCSLQCLHTTALCLSLLLQHNSTHNKHRPQAQFVKNHINRCQSLAVSARPSIQPPGEGLLPT